MAVREPADINAAFAADYNARDIDALMALYEAEATVVNMDGSESVGLAAIREHLAGLLQLGGSMTSTNRYAITSDEIAMVVAEWSVSFDDGRNPVGGRSSEVLRRQPDVLRPDNRRSREHGNRFRRCVPTDKGFVPSCAILCLFRCRDGRNPAARTRL